MGIIAFCYAVVCYVVFLGSSLYAIGFVGDLVVPKAIDSGPSSPLVHAVLVNFALLSLFAVQHSVMARPAFKNWWTKIVPSSVERCTYVLTASLLLLLLFWQWQPMAGVVWTVRNPNIRLILFLLFWLGWLVAVGSTFLISHVDLFGLRQAYLRFRGMDYSDLPFRETGLYRFVRHPMMLGFVIAFWATPDMTCGHLLFSIVTTGYILVGSFLEERDLADAFGENYRQYQRRVSMLLPWVQKRRR